MIATDRKDTLRMSRPQATALLLAAGIVLGACTPTTRDVAELPNRSLYSVNQPVVQRTDYVIDLAGNGGLAEGERERLHAWFQSLGLGYGDRIFVDQSYADAQTRNEIARVAAEYGMLLSDGAPVLAGGVPADGVRVIISRSTAYVPGCPNWEPAGPSATSPGYGCAINSNLAAMVADPSDLVLGQAGSGTGDASTASKAIQVYRQAAPTGAKGLTDTETRGNN